MNKNEFLRRLARTRGVALRIDQERGKGNHITIYFGDRLTVLKDRRKEIVPDCCVRCCGNSG